MAQGVRIPILFEESRPRSQQVLNHLNHWTKESDTGAPHSPTYPPPRGLQVIDIRVQDRPPAGAYSALVVESTLVFWQPPPRFRQIGSSACLSALSTSAGASTGTSNPELFLQDEVRLSDCQTRTSGRSRGYKKQPPTGDRASPTVLWLLVSRTGRRSRQARRILDRFQAFLGGKCRPLAYDSVRLTRACKASSQGAMGSG